MHGSSLVGCKDSIVQIGLIWAESLNKVIGADGSIPWHVSGDLKFFRRVTTGNVVVLGRKTFEAIGKPLPDRHTIVLSRSFVGDVSCVSSIDEALAKAKTLGCKEVWFAGGGEVYRQAISLADVLLVSTMLLS